MMQESNPPEPAQSNLAILYNKLRYKNYKMAFSATMSLPLATILFIIKHLQILALLVVDSATQSSIFTNNTSMVSLQTVSYVFVLKLPNVNEEIEAYLSVGVFVGNFIVALVLLLPCPTKQLSRLFSKIFTIGNIILPIPTIIVFMELIYNFEYTSLHYLNVALGLLAVIFMIINYTVYVNFHFAFTIKNISTNVLARFPNAWAKEFGWIVLTLVYKIVLRYGFPNSFIVYLLLYLGLACYQAKRYAVEFQYFDAKLNRNLGVLSLLIITINIAVLSSFLGIQLFKNSLTSFVCAFYIFFVNFFLTFRKFWIKRIIIDDNTTTEITQITYVTTFIVFSMNKSQKKNQAYVSSLLKNHCNNCIELDCCCKNRSVIYDPATNLSGKPKYQPHLDLVFVKHFYLKMIEDSIIEFPKSLDIRMLLALYHLEFLQLSPQFIKQIKFFNRKVIRDKLTVQQKFALYCLEQEFKLFVDKRNRDKGDKHIEKVKEFDEHFKNLINKVMNVIENLTYFWQTLNNLQSSSSKQKSEISPEFLRVISTKTLKVMQQILQTYEKMKQLNSSSAHFREIMFFYSKEVVNDMDLFIKIKQDLKLEKISRKLISEKHKTTVPLNIYGSRTANLVVKNINQIVWVSNNAKEIFGYKNNGSLLKSPINNLMPTYFANNHDNNVKNWLVTGKCRKMNQAKIIWCKRQNGACFRSVIYIKVMTHFVPTLEKDIHYYVAIQSIGNNQIICGADGQIYGCDEIFRNILKCPIKLLQNFRPNIQIFFPMLFQQFLPYFYPNALQTKKKIQDRYSGYIPGKIVDYITNFAKDKENFMNKNKKNALFNQVYGMYLEVKMQEITINLKGRYVTLDFEIEKIDLFGKEVVALKIQKLENDTIQKYYAQFQKTIKQILSIKQKAENIKQLTGAIGKKFEENQKESPLSIFLNPKKLKKLQEKQNQFMFPAPVKDIKPRNTSLQHRKQRAINQLAQIKNERVRQNIYRMKVALADNKIITPTTFKILTQLKENDDMYIIQEVQDEDLRETEQEKTMTRKKRQKSRNDFLTHNSLSDKNILDEDEGSLDKFLQKDKEAISFQQSTTSSAAFISLSTKIKLLKQKLWEIKPRRFLVITNILFILVIGTTVGVSTYELLFEQKQNINNQNKVEQQLFTNFRLIESLMSSKLAGHYQEFNRNQTDSLIMDNLHVLFQVVAFEQIETIIKTGQQAAPDFLETKIKLQKSSMSGPQDQIIMQNFILQEYELMTRNQSDYNFQEYGQIIQLLEKEVVARSNKPYKLSAAVYLLSCFGVVKVLIFINLYISLKKIQKVTRVMSQLYPQEKTKHLRIFIRLRAKIVSILRITNINECRGKSKSLQSYAEDDKNSRSKSAAYYRQYTPTCIKIWLLFGLVYLVVLASYGVLAMTDGQIKAKGSQCDTIALVKLKLTYKLLAMHHLQYAGEAHANQARLAIQGIPIQIVPMLVRLFNDESTSPALKQVIEKYSASNICSTLSVEEWKQFTDFVRGWRAKSALESVAKFCGEAQGGIFKKGILNGLQYVDEEINYYANQAAAQWPESIMSQVLHTSLLQSVLSINLIYEFFLNKGSELVGYFRVQVIVYGLLVLTMVLVGLVWRYVQEQIARLGCMHNCYLLIIPFDLMIENPYVRQYLKEELEFKTNI